MVIDWQSGTWQTLGFGFFGLNNVVSMQMGSRLSGILRIRLAMSGILKIPDDLQGMIR